MRLDDFVAVLDLRPVAPLLAVEIGILQILVLDVLCEVVDKMRAEAEFFVALERLLFEQARVVPDGGDTLTVREAEGSDVLHLGNDALAERLRVPAVGCDEL